MKDAQIRKALQSTLLKKYYDDNNCKVVEEMNVCHGEARIDIAIVNGSLWGVEIKSESDTLQRLEVQVQTYLKVFDYVTVVTGPKYCDQVRQLVPPCCGIVSIQKKRTGIEVKQLQRPTKNRHKNSYNICQLLWKDEVLLLLKEFGFTKGLSGKSKFYLWNLLASSTPQQKLSKSVTRLLKNRISWKEDPPLKKCGD